ncbi:MAG: hypothetical protein WC006_00100 [Bacilli bacterium]
MFLNIFVSIIVVFSVIMLFFLAVIVNGLTKKPDNVELPEQCSSCNNNSCYIRFDDSPKPKETIQEFYKKCEENNANTEAN